MVKSILLLARPDLINLFGLNEARNCRDKKKKRRLVVLLSFYCLLVVMMMFYIGLMSYGLASIGLWDAIPSVISTLTGLVILMFTMFKAQGTLFDLIAYERLIALPVKPLAIVVSRFLVMYVTNLALSILAVLPAMGVYAWYAKPAASVYIMFVLGAFLMPLIPMAIACALGALVAGVASRMRHRSFVSIVLAIIATLAAVVLPSLISQNINIAEISRLSRVFTSLVSRLYPPAGWFAGGVVSGDWGELLPVRVCIRRGVCRVRGRRSMEVRRVMPRAARSRLAGQFHPDQAKALERPDRAV